MTRPWSIKDIARKLSLRRDETHMRPAGVTGHFFDQALVHMKIHLAIQKKRLARVFDCFRESIPPMKKIEGHVFNVGFSFFRPGRIPGMPYRM